VIQIPNQLKNKNLRFIPLRGKKPFTKDWTKHHFDYEGIQRFLQQSYNYGVVCGIGDEMNGYLLVIDVDHPTDDFAERLLREMPKTFTVRTGSGGLHFYYFTERPVKSTRLDLDECHIDVQGEGKQVVGPNSIHPNGNLYIVISDRPIARLRYGDLYSLFGRDVLKKKFETQGQQDVSQLKELLDKILEKVRHQDMGEYYLISCPFHPPDINPSFVIYKNTFLGLDCHDNSVYLLKDIAKKVGVELKSKKEQKVVSTLVDDEYLLRAQALYDLTPYFYDSKISYFYLYDQKEGIYKQVDDDELISYFLDDLDAELRKGITSTTVKTRLLNGMKLIGLRKKPLTPPKTWIKFSNIIIDIKTLDEIKPTPEYFFTNSIPHPFGTHENTPTIDRLFESWVGSDEKIKLYELIAYSMLRDYPIHRIFILHGTGRNGKGSFLRLLSNFLGRNNIASTDLERLDSTRSRFETSKLYQKLVAMCGETNFSVLKNSAILKSLSGQDLVPAEYKFKSNFEFENYAKIIIATNSLPATLDTTDGFFSRMIILDFPNIFNKGKDIIKEIPLEEYSALARKSIFVLKELLERGSFYNEGTIEEKRERYEERANPLKQFIREKCVDDIRGFIPSTEFYNEFIKWLAENKPRSRHFTWKEVKTMLENDRYQTGVRKFIKEENQQRRCIEGLRWKDESDEVRESKVSEKGIFETTVTKIRNGILEIIKERKEEGITQEEIIVEVSQRLNVAEEQVESVLKQLIKQGSIFRYSYKGWEIVGG